MYSDYFKLKFNPFGETPNTKLFFKSKSHVEAISQILEAIKQGHGFSTITGEVGVGKTILSRMLLNYLGRRIPTALILNPVVNQAELLQSIREEFKISDPVESTIKSEYDQISKFLIETGAAKKISVLIIDEAQRLTFEGLEAVRLLSNLETEERKLIHIILVGQPEMNMKLNEFEFRQLNQRIRVRAKIEVLSSHEVESYLRYRIDLAGGANFVRFEPAACQLIAAHAKGVPRLINFLAEAAVARAEVCKMRLIDTKLVRNILPQPKQAWSHFFKFGRGPHP